MRPIVLRRCVSLAPLAYQENILVEAGAAVLVGSGDPCNRRVLVDHHAGHKSVEGIVGLSIPAVGAVRCPSAFLVVFVLIKFRNI